MQLQPHQRAIVRHFTQACCRQPGMLLYHLVGTGKTLAAIGILMSSPAYKAVVFCPSEIVFMWEQELDRAGADHARVRVRPLESMAKTHVRDCIVIVDEAHFWLLWLQSGDAAKRDLASRAYTNLATAHRRILLTASPVDSPFRQHFDVACLCNLAAGSELFPFSQLQFQQLYTKVNVAKSLLFGWYLSSLASLLNVVGIGGFLQSIVAEHVDSITTMDSKRFYRDAQPILSYYASKAADAASYPSFKVHHHESPLSLKQTLRWWELARSALDPAHFQGMAIHDENVHLVHASIVDTFENYLRVARRVGIYAGRPGAYPQKYWEVLKLMRRRAGLRRCVVFTELPGAMRPFADFLAAQKVEFRKLSKKLGVEEKGRLLDAFEREEFPVLLLSKDMYFGITVKGARQLHVMEPIMSEVIKTQLYGRVVRYMSHAHLPPKERHVDIYVHVGVPAKGWTGWFYKKVLPWVYALKHERDMRPAARALQKRPPMHYPTLQSPDDIVASAAKEMNKDVETAFSNGVSLPCPARYRCDEPCDIWDPPKLVQSMRFCGDQLRWAFVDSSTSVVRAQHNNSHSHSTSRRTNTNNSARTSSVSASASATSN